MRISVLAALVLAVAGMALAGHSIGVANAAPKENNKNAEVVVVDCEGLGTLEVVTVEHAVSAFGPDGQVFVAKRLRGDVAYTFTTFDGEEFGPFFDSFEAGAKGKGFEGRLVKCTAADSFTDTFALDEGAADMFGIPVEYLGTPVTVEGTEALTAWIIVPGH